LNAIDEAIGRSTEMGRPVLMVPGIGALNAISVQALNIFAYVAKTAARFANPIRVCCADAAVYTVGQEIIRDAYQEEGMSDRYDPDSVRFISDRQFAFAAGVSGIILREQVAAAFFMGEFFAESLIFAETANSVGAIQVASSTQSTQTPFFIAACDYVLIGDEFYAASAYLTRKPVLVGSLIGQDWSKLLVAASVFFGVVVITFQMGVGSPKTIQTTHSDTIEVPTTVTMTAKAAGPYSAFEVPIGTSVQTFAIKDGVVVQTPLVLSTDGQKVAAISPRYIQPKDTDIQRIFYPQRDKTLKVTREEIPKLKEEEKVPGTDPDEAAK
jgi:hypothetical protein